MNFVDYLSGRLSEILLKCSCFCILSVTAAGENAGQLLKAGCAAPPMAAPPALCPRGPWSFIFEFTKAIEKHPRQNHVSWPVGVAGVGVPAQGRGRRILDIGGIEYQ